MPITEIGAFPDYHRTYAKIDLDAVLHNFNELKKELSRA